MNPSECYETDQKVSAFKKDTIEKAEQIILKEFPAQIEALNLLLNGGKFDLQNVERVHVDSGIPVPFASNGTCSNKRKRTSSSSSDVATENCGFNVETLKGGSKVLVLPAGSAPINTCLRDLIEELKPRIRQLIEHATTLRMWIIFLIPRIEDGNNFGVGIQEDALEEVRAVESETASYFEHFSRYYLSRAKIIAKIAKYPHIEDFRQTLKELDERQLLELKLTVSEMRNHYAALYDLIVKNFEKIRKPRSYNNTSMY